MAAVDDLRDALSLALSSYAKGGKSGGRLAAFRTLPMTTDKVWRGIPLSRAMSPPVPSEGVETEALFDNWLWPVRSGEGEDANPLIEEGSHALARFVMQGEDFGTRTARLLFALSNADGAHLVHAKHALMVHHGDHSYGIIDGKVFSRFCDGMSVKVDHESLLKESKEVRVRTREFCYLWREAYLRQENLVDPLVALWQSATILQWSRLVTSLRGRKVPSQALMDQWLYKIEYDQEDPTWKMYRALVPRWMTCTEYNNVFGPTCLRGYNPDDRARQNMITKLCDWYHRKTKGVKR